MSEPNEMPPSPVSQSMVGAIHLFQLMTDYMAAGFTTEQAFALTSMVLQSSIMVNGITGSGNG